MYSFVKKFFIIITIVTTLFGFTLTTFAAGNIESSQKYSQFIDVDLDGNGVDDFINWSPTQGGATVGDSTITGYIWGEGVGWINLGPLSASGAGVTNTCNGVLGGYAWGQHTGWINFAPTNSDIAPNVNTSTGQITGQIWAQNYGWIELASPNVTYPGLDSSWGGCATDDDEDESNDPVDRQCNDHLDNDSDGLIDPLDPGCHTDGDPNNPATYVPLDDSEDDGWFYDKEDPIDPIKDDHIDDDSDDADDAETDNDKPLLFLNDPIEPNSLAPIFIPEITSETFPWLPRAITILAIAGLLSTVPGMITRTGHALLTFVWGRRKIRGVIYDSKTKEPLDPVYVSVIDLTTNQEVKNQQTDMEGRFGFVLPKGHYKIVAGKTNYQFPSVMLAGRVSDEVYDRLYFGEPFTVENEEQVVSMNIPMDPTGNDWNQVEKHKLNFLQYLIKGQTKYAWVFDSLFVIGFLASIMITYFYPVWWNYVMTCLYLILALIQVYGHGAIYAGTVTKGGIPLRGVVVRAWNATLNHEVAKRVTEASGAYYMLVPKADYFVTIDQRNLDGTFTRIFTSEVFNANHGCINKDFNL